MHMVCHQMAFDDLTLLLPSQCVEDRTQLTTRLPKNTAGVVTPTSGAFYGTSAIVPLTAVANSGSSFVNWTGGVANANSASTTVTMNSAKTITANFTELATDLAGII
jgi:hypothetical protein